MLSPICKRPDTVKATSSLIHVLSLDDSKTALSRAESSLLQLSKPKTRPIVEQFHGEIHVIDSLPFELAWNKQYYWAGSHEVFDRDNGCLVEEVAVPASFPVLGSHLVVGNKIFAADPGSHSVTRTRTLAFDSRRNRWLDNANASQSKLFSQDMSVEEPSRFPKDLTHILGNSIAGSVGGFPYGDPQDPLYVVISLGVGGFYGGYVSYLVNSSGRVLCTQSLTRLFKGLNAWKGKIFRVEEDVLQTTRTMCSIVLGRQEEWDDCCEFKINVMINTFDVKEHPDAADKVREVAARGSKAWPVEMEFVQVEVLDKYVFKRDCELDEGGEAQHWVDVQACFL